MLVTILFLKIAGTAAVRLGKAMKLRQELGEAEREAEWAEELMRRPAEGHVFTG